MLFRYSKCDTKGFGLPRLVPCEDDKIRLVATGVNRSTEPGVSDLRTIYCVGKNVGLSAEPTLIDCFQSGREGHAISRKGVRKKKLEIVQLWRCASCKRTFTPGPAALRNKTYPIRLVLQALTLYNLGYSLNETAKRLKSNSGRAISPSTIATWIGAHKEHTTFRRLRAEATTIYPPAQTIRSIKLYHRQIYAYAYHRSKLTLMRCNPQHRRFEALATFLENVPATCPHELFRREDDPKARASQARPAFADPGRIVINRKENTATATAALIIPAVGANKLRHETLQNFMLANDSSTVAVEIPIWLTEDEIIDLETRYGIELAAGGARPARALYDPVTIVSHNKHHHICPAE